MRTLVSLILPPWCGRKWSSFSMQIHPHRLHRWLGATLVFFCFPGDPAFAQTSSEDSSTLRQILERLDRLEQQNRDLTAEVGALRKELAGARPAPGSTPAGTETAKAAPPPISPSAWT